MGLLADGPRHGYELKTLYEDQLAPTVKLNFGQVYPALERLERDGWVEHDVVSQQERPDKKVFALTKAGKQQLRVWIETPSAPSIDARNETFVKLMLARRLGRAVAMEALKTEKRACFNRLHELTQARARAKEEDKPVQAILLLDLAVLRLEAFMKWLEKYDEAVRQEGQP